MFLGTKCVIQENTNVVLLSSLSITCTRCFPCCSRNTDKNQYRKFNDCSSCQNVANLPQTISFIEETVEFLQNNSYMIEGISRFCVREYIPDRKHRASSPKSNPELQSASLRVSKELGDHKKTYKQNPVDSQHCKRTFTNDSR